MKISKIRVENFRSLKSLVIETSRFNIFVGQNNHGKTNLFEAIHWFYNSKSSTDDLHFNRDSSLDIEVELFFDEVVQADIDKLSVDGNRTKITKMLNGGDQFSISKSSIDHKRIYIVAGVDHGNPSGMDAAINEFIPKLEYISTVIRLDDVSKYKEKNPIGLMLSGLLAEIVENSEQFKELKEAFSKLFGDNGSNVREALNKISGQVEGYLQKQFPDGTTVSFGVAPPLFGDLLKTFETVVNDGVPTRAEDKGDGMQRAIMLSIIQTYADYRKTQNGAGSFLFLIDEAELHLHPSAQRKMKQSLLDIATADQVFINTHSSVLVVDDAPGQSIFRVNKEEGETSISEVDSNNKIDVVYELLGGSPSDLLLPRNFMIVEGRSEYVFLTEVIRRFYPGRFNGIKILFSGGDITRQEGSLVGVHNSFAPLATASNPLYRDRVVIVIDRPNARNKSKYDEFMKGYSYLTSNNQLFEIGGEALEESYPEGYRRVNGETGKWEKVPYAKEVAMSLTQDQFESEMKPLFDALQRAEELAFSRFS